MGFDKIIDLLFNFIEAFRFFTVIDAFERGVVLRFGKFSRVLHPGFHFMWPFFVEKVLTDVVTRRTENLKTQGLTTKDGKVVSVGIACAIAIKNIKVALLETEGVDQALRDSCSGALGAHVAQHTWDELRTGVDVAELTKRCRAEALQYGIKIHRVQITDLIPARGIHLYLMNS